MTQNMICSWECSMCSWGECAFCCHWASILWILVRSCWLTVFFFVFLVICLIMLLTVGYWSRHLLLNCLFFLFYFKILHNCISFAKYQNESATGIHVFTILNPPPSSVPIPSLWVVPELSILSIKILKYLIVVKNKIYHLKNRLTMLCNRCLELLYVCVLVTSPTSINPSNRVITTVFCNLMSFKTREIFQRNAVIYIIHIVTFSGAFHFFDWSNCLMLFPCTVNYFFLCFLKGRSASINYLSHCLFENVTMLLFRFEE